MTLTKSKDEPMTESMPPEPPDSGPARPAGDRPAPRKPSASPFRMYKPAQGAYVRWGSAGGAGLITLAFGNFLYEQLQGVGLTAQTLVPVVVMAALAILLFRLIGQNRTIVDFMIATEGEMKKVSWSTRKEVIGATKVVIVAVLALSLMLFVVDLLFIVVFSAINVLHIDVLGKMFGGGNN